MLPSQDDINTVLAEASEDVLEDDINNVLAESSEDALEDDINTVLVVIRRCIWRWHQHCTCQGALAYTYNVLRVFVTATLHNHALLMTEWSQQYLQRFGIACTLDPTAGSIPHKCVISASWSFTVCNIDTTVCVQAMVRGWPHGHNYDNMIWHVLALISHGLGSTHQLTKKSSMSPNRFHAAC